MNSRRTFLKTIAGVATLFSIPSISLAKEKVKKIALPLSKLNALQKVGGSAVVDVKSKKVMLVREKKDKITALDAKCTHEGCIVEYNSKAKKIECPCHGSEFALEGKVLKGPADKPLMSYDSKISGDRIIIEIK